MRVAEIGLRVATAIGFRFGEACIRKAIGLLLVRDRTAVEETKRQLGTSRVCVRVCVCCANLGLNWGSSRLVQAVGFHR